MWWFGIFVAVAAWFFWDKSCYLPQTAFSLAIILPPSLEYLDIGMSHHAWILDTSLNSMDTQSLNDVTAKTVPISEV